MIVGRRSWAETERVVRPVTAAEGRTAIPVPLYTVTNQLARGFIVPYGNAG